ncbi:MAG: T9SS type A sorting domain-containing protein [Bacteroidota bacterium]
MCPSNKFKYYQFFLLCLVLLGSLTTSAQVFPGDANNNGIVNNVDLLYIGYAYGAIGPARQTIGEAPNVFEVSADWAGEFPAGQNFSHADADGNGLVELLDMLSVYLNYNENAGFEEPDEFLEGVPGMDPVLNLEVEVDAEPITSGSLVQIPIVLGSPDQPLDNVNGVAFTIKYPHEFVELIEFQITADWLDPDDTNALFSFQTQEGHTNVGELDVALTRFGPNPVSGWGEVGMLTIVIEDDLIGLLPVGFDSTTIIVELEDVKVVNDEFVDVAIVNDSLEMMVYSPDALTTSTEAYFREAIKVYPNPVWDQIYVNSSTPLDRVELFDLAGRRVQSQELNRNFAAALPIQHLDSGFYLLRISSPEGQTSRRISILTSN